MKNKTVKKNYIYNLIYQILLVVFPLITMPYVSRIIGAEGIGNYTYTFAIAGYFLIFIMLGIANYGSRKIAQARDNKEKLSEEFFSIYGLQFILSIIVTTLYCVYVNHIVHENKILAILQVIYVLTGMFDISWFFHGTEDFKKVTIKNIIIKTLSACSIFIFVKTKNDLFLYTIIMATTFLIGRMAMWPFLYKRVEFKIPHWSKIETHIKPCVTLFIPILAHGIFRIIDKVMLGTMANMSEVGYYEYAEKIINLPERVIETLNIVMLPRMSNLIINGKNEHCKFYLMRTIEFGMFVSIPIAFILITVADNIMPLYLGKEFTDAGTILKVLAMSLPFFVWSDTIKQQYMIPSGKDKEYTKAAVLGIILNIILNSILIPKYYAVGAALATMISEVIAVLKQSIGLRKELNIIQYLKFVIKFLIPSLIIFIIINVMSRFIENELILMLSQIVVGIILYCTMCTKYLKRKIREKEVEEELS